MVQALHHLIDQLAGILLTFLSKVEIDHGGFQLGMAHVSSDGPQVDPSLEKMSGIELVLSLSKEVAQGVNGDSLFVDSCGNLGTAEGALDTTFGHGKLSVLCSITVSAKGGEEEARV